MKNKKKLYRINVKTKQINFPITFIGPEGLSIKKQTDFAISVFKEISKKIKEKKR